MAQRQEGTAAFFEYHPGLRELILKCGENLRYGSGTGELRSQRVQNGDQADADVGEDGCPHSGDPETAQYHDECFDAEDEGDVLPGDAFRTAGEPDRGGNL